MARKLIQLALLTAGLFLSGNALAVGECLAMVGTVQQMSVSSGGCPAIGFRTINGIQCEVVNVGSGISGGSSQCICVEGSGCFDNYKFTGGLYTQTETYEAYTPPPYDNWGNSGSVLTEVLEVQNELSRLAGTVSTNAAINKNNIDILNANVKAVSQKSNVIISDTSVTNSRLQKLLTDYEQTKTKIDEIAQDTNEVLADQNQQSAFINSKIADLAANQIALAQNERQQSVQDELTSTNAILDKLSEVGQNFDSQLTALNQQLGGVYDFFNRSDIAHSQSELREQQMLTDLQRMSSVVSNVNEISLGSRDNTEQIELTLQNVLNTVNQISDEVVPEPCGGFFHPPCPPDGGSDGGGSSVDLTQTNQLLQQIYTQNGQSTGQIQNSINNSTNSIRNSIDDLSFSVGNLSNRSDLENSTSQITNSVNGLQNTLNGNHSDRAGQLAYYHSETMQALSSLGSGNGSGGSADDDTVTNEKLDGISSSLNGLGEKLDGIGTGIDGLSDALSPGTGQLTGPEKCEGPHCWKSKSWIETSYEEGMKTVWDEHKLAFNSSAMKSYLDGMFPKFGGSGGLEPAQFCFDMGFVNFGCFTLTIPPYVIAFIRICLLISAGFYCQRLIFGGA